MRSTASSISSRVVISPVAREDFVGERKTFRGDNQRDDDPLAVRQMIARVATLGFVDLFGFAFKIRASQIVKQHIEAGAEEIFPSVSQMLL